MMWVSLFVLVTVLCLQVHFTDANLKRVCYLTSWGRYRAQPESFKPENYGAHLCTHIIWAFATLDSTSSHIVATDPQDEAIMYLRLNALKNDNPHLKILLSIGGFVMGSEKFHNLVTSDDKITKFATNTVHYLHHYGFDGLDVDWEYPASRGSSSGDKYRFTAMLRILKQAFHQDHVATGRKQLMLTAAVTASPGLIDRYYEASQIALYVNFLNVMTYDFHGHWENHTGHHSALYGPAGEQRNIQSSANAWASRGVPKTKILLGIPFYGRTFTLQDNSHSAVGSSATGAGRAGEFTHEKGILAYYEVCNLLRAGAEGHRLTDQHVPYLVDGDRWVGYDDERSIQEKVQYTAQNGFGGIFVWALDFDDFSGVCGKQFPLMNAIKDTMTHLIGRRSLDERRSVLDAFLSVQSPTISYNGGLNTDFEHDFCSNRTDGVHGDPKNCHMYYQCVFHQTVREPCPLGLVFHDEKHVCDYPLPNEVSC